jgi:DNA transformation protein
MNELTTLKNIGETMAQKCRAVGINDAETLIGIGAKEAYVRLKAQFPNTCLVHLYALEGAILDTAIEDLSEGVRQDLKQFADAMKK